MASLTYRDVSASRKEEAKNTLFNMPDYLSLREIVHLRVREEVAKYNAAPSTVFNGLVQPKYSKQTASGYKVSSRKKLDWMQQAQAAEQAFLKNGFFILVNDKQVEDLDTLVELTMDLDIVFIKLVQLVGG